MGVVVRDAGTAVRRRNAKHLQLGLERVRFLRRAIVSMQHQRLAVRKGTLTIVVGTAIRSAAALTL